MKLNLKIGAAIVAAAGLTGGVANASSITVTGGAVNYSLEGQTIFGSTGVVTLPDLVITLGADYTLQDNIAVVIAGATVGGNTSTQLNVNGGTSAAPANGIHCWAAGPVENSIIVSLVNVTGNTIALRVTQKNVASSVGNLCRIRGIDVTSPSIAKLTTVTGTWGASTANNNVPFDASTPSPTTIAQTISQFTLDWGTTNATKSLSGVVDVTSGRKWFFSSATGNNTVGPAAAGNSDVTTSVATDLAAAGFFAGPVVTLNTATETLTGNFGELTGVGGCSAANAVGGFTLALATAGGPAGSQVLTVPTNCQSIVSVITPGAVGEAFTETYTFTGGKNQVISAPQAFAANVQFAYTGNVSGGGTNTGALSLAATNPGAWTLNGFSAFVSYMPFGTGISQVVYLTNKSNQTGAVTIVGYNDAGAVLASTAVGNIGPGTILVLSGPLNAAVNAAFGAGFTGKVSFNVIANIPAGLAELYTSYNVSGNRVNVVNTSNGRVVQGTAATGGNSTTGGNL